ncbi:MAG: hypothetical protein AABX82_02625 [Nanoarchaeota archaeon]
MSQLTNYIQKELDKGFSQDLIRKKLLQAGYTQRDIADSFKSLKIAEPILRRKFADTLHLETHIQWSKWIFGLLAIVVVIILGFLVYQYAGELPAFEVVETSFCDGTVEEKNICLLHLAQQGEDVCDQLSNDILKTLCTEKYWEKDSCNFNFLVTKDTEQREQCFWDQAVATQDASYCTRKVHDKIECLVQLAQETEDARVCGQYRKCYTQYALLIKDDSICEMLTDEFDKTQCKADYANNINT